MQNCLKSGKKHDYDSPTATQSTKKPDNSPFKTTITQRLVDGIEDELDGDIEKSSSNYVENLVQKQPKGSSSKKKQSSSSSSASSEKIETRDKGGFSQGVSQRTPSTAGGYRTTSTKTLVDDDIFNGNEEEDLVLIPEQLKKIGRSPNSSPSKKKKVETSLSSESKSGNEPSRKTGYRGVTSVRPPSSPPSGGYRTTTTKKLVDDDEDMFDGNILGNEEEDLIQKTSKPPAPKKVTPTPAPAPAPTQKGFDVYALCPKCKDAQCFKQCIKDLNGFDLNNGFVNTASLAATAAKNKQTTTGTFKGASTSRTLVDEDMFDGDILGNEEEDLIQKKSPPPAPKKVTPPPPAAQNPKNTMTDIVSTCKNCNGDKTCEKLCAGLGIKFDNGFVNTASQAAPAAKNKQTTTGTFKGASTSKTLVDEDDEIDADFDEDEE